MENSSTEVVHRQKKPFLGILNRRSTKIEPQNVSSDDSMLLGNHTNTSDEEQEAGSAHRPGIFNNKKILERNNTFPSLNTPTKCNSQYNNINNINDSETNSINRHSSYVDDRKALDSLCESENALKIELDSDGEPRTPSTIRRPLEITVKLDKPTYNLPSYESYPSPILLSCRSRFRDKFIPPSDKLETQNEHQHYSTPNISTQETTLERKDSKKSGSFDTIISSADTSTVSANFINDDKASADSLARQALMAAHVLHLIPTEKARQRNFLQGRLATNSLLGNAELEKVLPTREISIFVGSWNMNGQNPPKQLNDFVLPNGVEHVPDLFVIGTQESCSERFEWEVTLQETLGPSHVLFHSTALGTLHLAVYLRRDLIWYCSEPEDASLSVRPGTAFRTKGAVAISFCLFGTSMLFVTSHLTAHQQKIKERVQDVKRIIQALDLPRNLPVRYKNKDVTQNFDCVYWCGDLNFRLSEPRANLMKWLETTQFPLPAHLPHGFLHTDQLTSVLADGAAFKGFKEAKIHFPPTYKYDVGSQNFDTSNKQRAPAYTDRILYKYKLPPMGFRRTSGAMGDVTFGGSAGTPQSPIKCIAYDSVQSITSSDHKPVWALFRNSLRPGVDSIPLAAGLFNRDVYLEGMKRRLDNSNSEPSTVCSIQ